jgi:hypothetical protein
VRCWIRGEQFLAWPCGGLIGYSGEKKLRHQAQWSRGGHELHLTAFGY